MKRPLHALAAALVVLAGCSNEVHLQCTSAPEGLDAYWAGPSFDGLDLSAALIPCDTPGDDSQPGVQPLTYIYGDCTPQGGGCAPPIDIQTWPSSRPKPPNGVDTTVSGVPATRFGPSHLEIYHPDVTVVIFGDDGAQVDRFAAALERAPGGSTALAASGVEFDRSAGLGFLWFPVTLFAVALVVGRSWLLILPFVVVPVLMIGLHNGWWGNGYGDSIWLLPFLGGIAIGTAAVGLGLLLHRPLRARFRAS